MAASRLGPVCQRRGPDGINTEKWPPSIGAVAGITGKLTVLNGADKRDVELKPAGDKLVAKGVKRGSGSKAVASVVIADKKTHSVRFAIK